MKVVVSHKGKSYQTGSEATGLIGKKIGDEFDGNAINAPGYKLVITGGSDGSGFPMRPDVHGTAVRKIIITNGPGIRPRKGLRLAKRVHGSTIDAKIVQVNSKVVLEGEKKLEELFPKTEKKEEKDKKKK